MDKIVKSKHFLPNNSHYLLKLLNNYYNPLTHFYFPLNFGLILKK